MQIMCIAEPVRLWLILGLLLLSAGWVVSCYYSTDPPSKTNTTNTTDPTPKHKKNHTAEVITMLGGWPPTPNITKHWSKWLNDYKTKLDDEKAADEAKRGNMTSEEKEILKKERGNWPSNWQDLGPGHSGEVPPPWAFVPKNTGLPDFCFQWPQRGGCNNITTRWGYNSHANRCDQFVYSGCGENQNNFKDKLSCEQACMIPPISGCDTESQIPAGDDYDNVLGQ